MSNSDILGIASILYLIGIVAWIFLPIVSWAGDLMVFIAMAIHTAEISKNVIWNGLTYTIVIIDWVLLFVDATIGFIFPPFWFIFFKPVFWSVGLSLFAIFGENFSSK